MTIFEGWPRKDILEKYNETTVLPEDHLFDIGIHIRNQFGHFESNSEKENSNAALSVAHEYMNSTKYGNLVKNIYQKLNKMTPR